MPEWIVHTYWIVPALVAVNSNEPPLPKSLDLKSAPDCAVTLWSVVSSLTHLTFWPTLTVVALGENWMFCILISASPPPPDEVVGVDVLGVDVLGVEVLGVDVLGVDVLPDGE